MDDSESDISNVDLDIMSSVSADMKLWYGFCKSNTVYKTHKEVTKEKLMTHSKETLAKCLLKCLLIGYQTVHAHIESLSPLEFVLSN
jgi:hypothetical protein